MAQVIPSRAEQRRNWSVPIRVEQLENDMDTTDAVSQRIEDKLDKLNARIYGFIVALAVASITFAGGLAVHH